MTPLEFLAMIGASLVATAILALLVVCWGCFVVWLGEKTGWYLYSTEESIAKWKAMPYINMFGEETDFWGNRLREVGLD